jgi:sugar phosphate isomerase/epimerase
MHFALSTHLFHGERLSRTHLELMAARGFTTIEVFATATHFAYRDAHAVDELAGWLAALHMRAASMHAPICASFTNGEWGRAFSNASSDPQKRDEAVGETTAALAAARRLGCETMVLHLGLPRGQKIPAGDNDRGAVRRSLDALVGAAANAGVQLALEVIPNDLSSPSALLDWFDPDLGAVPAGICLDFGHAHLLGGTVDAAETLAGHAISTHVHDNRGKSDDHLVPFAGTIDWPMTLAAMWKVGYAGPLVFEVADHGDAMAVLDRAVSARSRLQGILDGLAEQFEFSEG